MYIVHVYGWLTNCEKTEADLMSDSNNALWALYNGIVVCFYQLFDMSYEGLNIWL